MFGAKKVPSVGISLGIDRLLAMMEQLQKDQNQVCCMNYVDMMLLVLYCYVLCCVLVDLFIYRQVVQATETKVLVSVLGDDLSQAAELVGECWDAKLKAKYMVNKQVRKHINRAIESSIPWMVIVGERELEKGVVKLKDVVANKEEEVPRSNFVEELRRRMS